MGLVEVFLGLSPQPCTETVIPEISAQKGPSDWGCYRLSDTCRKCKTVINALVFSRLFYCSSVWSGISTKNVLKLQSVQNFASRIVTSTRKYDHIRPILRDLNWLNVESIKFRDGIMASKCMNGGAPEHLCDQFILRSKIHSRNTRNKDKLAIPLCKTAAGQKSFVYRATSIWNGLSQDLINLNDPNSFKRLYKLSLLEQ